MKNIKICELPNPLLLVPVILTSIVFGYNLATMKINKCKSMTPEEAFNNKTCREFYLGK